MDLSTFFDNATPDEVAKVEAALSPKTTKVTSEDVINALKSGVVSNLNVSEWLKRYKTYNKGTVESVNDLDSFVSKAKELHAKLEKISEVELEVSVPLKVKIKYSTEFKELLSHTYRGKLERISDWLSLDNMEIEAQTDYLDDNQTELVRMAAEALEDASIGLEAVDIDGIHDCIECFSELYEDAKKLAIAYDKLDVDITDEQFIQKVLA